MAEIGQKCGSQLKNDALVKDVSRENNELVMSEMQRFSGDTYHQTFGITMGTPFVVTAANAFMYYHERDIIESYSRNLTLYKRFMDDIFLIWDEPRETLLEFLSDVNTKDERIKITYEISNFKIFPRFLFQICCFSKILHIIRCNTLPFRNRLISICINHLSLSPH